MMRIFAIGDVHGCYRELCDLLDQMAPRQEDKIWFCGDLVGRGPEPAEVVRLVSTMANAEVVLGNHDLHLLAIAAGIRADKPSLRLGDLLGSPGLDGYVEWLRARPLMLAHRDILLVHACCHPQWDGSSALAYAAELGEELLSEGYAELLGAMYGDSPTQWSEGLDGFERSRTLLNIFTRARYFLPDFSLNLARDDRPDHGPDDDPSIPWYELPHRRSPGQLLFFGHWSALADYNIGPEFGVFHLDKGCVWGNRLFAAEISWGDGSENNKQSSIGEAGAAELSRGAGAQTRRIIKTHSVNAIDRASP